MLQALGYRFLDKNGSVLGAGGRILNQVAIIDSSFAHPALKEAHFSIACDVRNPFCGPEGAAFVFAPQKGADAHTVQILDAGMESLARLIAFSTGIDVSTVPGAGAAGGLGGAFLAFLNAELKPGIQLLLQTLAFKEKIKGADLIITGEGKIDRQSVMGKVPYGILQEAKLQNIPVIVLAGSVADLEVLNQVGFRGIYSIHPPSISLETAMKPEVAKRNISQTIARILSSNIF